MELNYVAIVTKSVMDSSKFDEPCPICGMPHTVSYVLRLVKVILGSAAKFTILEDAAELVTLDALRFSQRRGFCLVGLRPEISSVAGRSSRRSRGSAAMKSLSGTRSSWTCSSLIHSNIEPPLTAPSRLAAPSPTKLPIPSEIDLRCEK